MSINISRPKLSSALRYSRQHPLQRDTLFGVVTTIFRGVATVALTYITVRALSKSEFGAWSLLLLMTTQGYLGLIDLGLHGPMTREMAAHSDPVETSRHALFQWYQKRITLHALVVAPILVLVVHLVSQFGTFEDSAIVVSLLLVNLLLFDAALLPYFALYEAMGQFLMLRTLELLHRILLLGFTVSFFAIWTSLPSLLAASSVASAAILGICVLKGRSLETTDVGQKELASRRSISSRRVELLLPSRRQRLGALSARIASTIQWQIGRTVVIVVLGLSAAGDLEAANRFVAVIALLVGSLTGALLPRLVKATGNDGQLSVIMQRSARWIFIVSLPAIAYSMLNVELAVTILFGESYQSIVPTLKILLIGQIIINIGSLADLSLVASNLNHLYAVSRWIGLLFSIPLTLTLGKCFGLVGLAIGLVSSSLLSALLSLHYLARLKSERVFSAIIVAMKAGLIITAPIGFLYILHDVLGLLNLSLGARLAASTVSLALGSVALAILSYCRPRLRVPSGTN